MKRRNHLQQKKKHKIRNINKKKQTGRDHQLRKIKVKNKMKVVVRFSENNLLENINKLERFEMVKVNRIIKVSRFKFD